MKKSKAKTRLACLIACLTIFLGNVMGVSAEEFIYVHSDGTVELAEAEVPPAVGANGLPTSISSNAYGLPRTALKYVFEVTFLTPGGNYIYGDWSDTYTPEQLAILYAAIDASGVTPEMSEYDKCVAFNNYICDVFGYNMYVREDEDIEYDPWDGLVILQKTIQGVHPYTVCVAYADLFQTMCEISGIECWLQSNLIGGGFYGNNHIWNVVRADGEWYCTDVTWNDSSRPNRFLMKEAGALKPWDDDVHTVWAMGHDWLECSVYSQFEGPTQWLADYPVVPDVFYVKHIMRLNGLL